MWRGLAAPWNFIIIFGAVLVSYAAINIGLAGAWDPYPFILLNLFLSMLAAIQAPVIMMSQNRQDNKDRRAGTRFRRQPPRRDRDSGSGGDARRLLGQKVADVEEFDPDTRLARPLTCFETLVRPFPSRCALAEDGVDHEADGQPDEEAQPGFSGRPASAPDRRRSRAIGSSGTPAVRGSCGGAPAEFCAARSPRPRRR